MAALSRKKASKNDLWLLLGLGLLAAGLALGFWLFGQRSGGVKAALSVEGQVVEVFDLEKEEDRYIDLRADYGLPVTLEIRDHAIRFYQSQCPDHLCEGFGFLSQAAQSAACLPNRCVLTLYSDQGS